MNTRTAVPAAVLLFFVPACGGSTPPAKSPDDTADAGDNGGDGEAPATTASNPAPGSGDDSSGKSSNPCSGFDMDLMNALNLSACEVANVNKSVFKAKDIKDSVTVTAMVDQARIAPGGHADIVITFKNKSAAPVSLDFTVDPTPRFSVETYSAKTNKRVDLPATPEPKIPEGMDRTASEAKTARITLTANGAGTIHVPWDAVKTRWAPEKLKGTPPEMGYPRVPAGPLPKGKYNLRIITPLTNVFEGVDHEMSAPRTSIDIQ